jgi:sugar phosphate isomerase/epimerase
MRFAFSTLACPHWDLPTICRKAREMGYDGVEVRAFFNEPLLTASNIALSDPTKVRDLFAEQHQAIACLSTSIHYTGRRAADEQAAADLRRAIDLATQVGCPMVRVADAQLRPGQARQAVVAALGAWLAPAADYAASKSVRIVVENQLSFRNARAMWLICEVLDHPAVALCWDILNATLVGETPAVAIPLLNSRIGLVQVRDAWLRPTGAVYCPLGQGDVPVAETCNRLRGIGYDGWISFEYEKAWLPGLAEPEQSLPQALEALKDLTHPQWEPVAAAVQEG